MDKRNMPYSLEAEQSVLGSAFLSKYALQKLCDELSRDDFYLESHMKIYDVLSELNEEGKPIDITIVTDKLEKNKTLSSIGNIEYLLEVINSVPSASNIDYYINIVHEKALLRRLISVTNDIAGEAYLENGNVNDILDGAEAKILNVVKTRKSSEFHKIQDVVFKAQENLEKLCNQKGEITGLATGFYEIDKLTSGLHENEFIIIAARPAMGKTAFALNIATNIAKTTNKAVALFNLEMNAEQLVTRMFSSLAQVEGTKLRTGKLDNNDWAKLSEGISQLADTNIYIDDTPGITIGDIRSKCRRLEASKEGLGIVIIDYLQLISGSNKYAGNRQQEVSEISRGLKMMALELGVPVIALAQLSRAVEGRDDKRPLMSDLRESGSIEQDADIVAFLYRDDYYNKEARMEGNISISEFIVAKHRNGPTATIELLFKKNTSTFANYSKEEV
ncbi:MAG: replicative DNA helicase [Bacilli bacterium]|nr:replicative DNA helicase [Bacilli bacterium]MBP3635579.1 replicative DNA helicase [Bacilli bacterium]